MLKEPTQDVASTIKYWDPDAAAVGPVEAVPTVAAVIGRHFRVPTFDHPVGGVYVTAHTVELAGIVKPSAVSKPMQTAAATGTGTGAGTGTGTGTATGAATGTGTGTGAGAGALGQVIVKDSLFSSSADAQVAVV